MCSTTTTKFGNKTRSLHTKQTERKFDSLCAYSAYAVHFFLGQFPNMELMLLLLSPFFFFTELLYFLGCVTSVNITLF